MTSAPLSLAALKAKVGSGLLSFPVTHFKADGSFDEAPYRRHVERLAQYDAAALFAAGGTGEYFSLTLQEYPRIVKAAAESMPASMPLIAGVGYGTHPAIAFATAAEKAGAHGILVLPPYLVGAEQEGLYRHVKAICDSVGIGVIVYNRDNCVLTADTVARLADACPNLIGFKDGVGNVELLVAVRQKLGDRLTYVAACRPPKSMRWPARRWASRPTRPQCSTSSPNSRWSSSSAACRRPGWAGPHDPGVLPALSRDPQPPPRLRGQPSSRRG